VQSRSRSSEVFDACVALIRGGELEASVHGRRIHVICGPGTYELFVDDERICEGDVFDVASMFVTTRRAYRGSSSRRLGSHTRLRALSDIATVPTAVVSFKKN